jgi:hypothetical protein
MGPVRMIFPRQVVVIGTTRTVQRTALRASVGVLLLVATSAPSAHAQVDFGLTAGPAIADFSGSYVDSSIPTWGLYGSAFVEWHFSEHFSVEGAVATSQKGAFEVESPLTDEPHDYRTSYLEIPIAFNYRNAFFGDKWGYRVFAGGAAAFSNGCDVKPSSQFSFDEECTADTPGGELAGNDFLIQVGFGVDRIFKGGSGVGFDARYSFGTSNLLSDAVDNDLTVKNRVLDIRVRFFLPITGPRK